MKERKIWEYMSAYCKFRSEKLGCFYDEEYRNHRCKAEKCPIIHRQTIPLKDEKKYIVFVKEVWERPIPITAKNKEEAIEKVKSVENLKNLTTIGISYRHTLDADQWEVTEEE